MLLPTADCTASTAASMLLTHWVTVLDIAEVIQSDQGSHFTGQIFRKLCEAMGMEQRLRDGESVYTGLVTVASCQSCGISPVAKDRLKKSAREGARSVAASVSRLMGMLSNPALLWVSSDLSKFSTSCGEVVML